MGLKAKNIIITCIKQYISTKPRGKFSSAVKNCFLKIFREKKFKNCLQAKIPWVSYNCQQLIANLLQNKKEKNIRIAEFGGGGSTLFFLGQASCLVTVEHDPQWFALLKSTVWAKGYEKKWTAILVPPDLGPPSLPYDYADPDNYSSSESENVHYKSYACALDAYPDSFFDLILVDGRARPACVKHAAPKISSEGHLIMDNTERSYYLEEKTRRYLAEFSVVFDEFGPVPGLDHFTRSTVFQKRPVQLKEII
jgi:predicted O-methyltransferase YrrM